MGRGPRSASTPVDPPRTLPGIPALVVTNVDDMLAPMSAARQVASLIPGARVLRLRGAGHGMLSTGASSCAEGIVEDFLAGSTPTEVCGPEHQGTKGAAKPPPLSLADLEPDPRVGGRAGRTLTAVNATMRDGGDMLEGQFFGRIFRLHTRPGRSARKALLAPLRAGALRQGTYAMRPNRWRLVLRKASYVPGVRIDGWTTFAQNRAARRGVMRVSGPGAARGTLTIRRGTMSGRLGGRMVSAPVRLHPDLGVRLPVTASSSRLERLVAPRLPFPGPR